MTDLLHDPTNKCGRRSLKPGLKHVHLTRLAKKLQIGQSYLSEILSGKARPSMAVGKRLADVMGWTLDQVALIPEYGIPQSNKLSDKLRKDN